MTTYNPFFVDRQFYDTGIPLVGGLLYTYAAGAGNTAQLAAYQDPLGATPFSNPIVMNAGGLPVGGSGNPVPIIWLTGNLAYKFILEDANGNVIWELDNYLQSPTLNLTVPFTSNTGSNSVLYTIFGAAGQLAYSGGWASTGDGGDGWWYWNATSTATDDNGSTVITPTGSSGAGRWLRIVVDHINVAWFGAVGNGITNCAPAFNLAYSAAAAYKLPLYLPNPGGTAEYALNSSSNLVLNGIPMVIPTGVILYPVGTTPVLVVCPVITDIGYHFNLSTTGSHVVFDAAQTNGFTVAAPSKVYPQWFGAVNSNNTDAHVPIQQAIQCAIDTAAYDPTVTVQPIVAMAGNYATAASIALSGVQMIGDDGARAGLTQIGGSPFDVLTNNVSTGLVKNMTITIGAGGNSLNFIAGTVDNVNSNQAGAFTGQLSPWNYSVLIKNCTVGSIQNYPLNDFIEVSGDASGASGSVTVGTLGSGSFYGLTVSTLTFISGQVYDSGHTLYASVSGFNFDQLSSFLFVQWNATGVYLKFQDISGNAKTFPSGSTYVLRFGKVGA
jgi:hypothetical protein